MVGHVEESAEADAKPPRDVAPPRRQPRAAPLDVVPRVTDDERGERQEEAGDHAVPHRRPHVGRRRLLAQAGRAKGFAQRKVRLALEAVPAASARAAAHLLLVDSTRRLPALVALMALVALVGLLLLQPRGR